MNTVMFDEEPRMAKIGMPERGLAGWLLKHHIATTPSQAALYLLGIALACFVGAVALFHRTVTTDTIDPLKNFAPAYTR